MSCTSLDLSQIALNAHTLQPVSAALPAHFHGPHFPPLSLNLMPMFFSSFAPIFFFSRSDLTCFLFFHQIHHQAYFALLRMLDGDRESKRVKFVMIVWAGEDVPAMTRSRFGVHYGSVRPLFGVTHTEVKADNHKECSETVIRKALKVPALAVLSRGKERGRRNGAGTDSKESRDVDPPLLLQICRLGGGRCRLRHGLECGRLQELGQRNQSQGSCRLPGQGRFWLSAHTGCHSVFEPRARSLSPS